MDLKALQGNHAILGMSLYPQIVRELTYKPCERASMYGHEKYDSLRAKNQYHRKLLCHHLHAHELTGARNCSNIFNCNGRQSG